MDLSLTPEEQQLVATVRTLLRKDSPSDRVRAAEKTGFDPDLWAVLQEIGIPSMAAGDEQAGAATLFQLALVAEQCGAALASAPVLEGIVATRLLDRCDERGSKLLEFVRAGDVITTVSFGATAARVPALVPAGAIAHLVLALVGEDLVAVRSPPGQRIDNLGSLPLAFWEPEGRASTILASGARARSAFAAAETDWKALSAAQLVGVAASALEIGVNYVKSREVFGAPIATFQTIAHTLADDATAIEGARLLAYKAGWVIDDGRDEAPVLASMAWLFASETALTVTRDSLHFHGGYGFTAEYDIQLYFRRAKAYSLLWGDPRNEFKRLGDLLFTTLDEDH
jgi:alkylation response protein AidB-like acyl-CoA dehydrogenase